MTRLVFEHIPIAENGEPLVDLSTYDFELESAYYNQGVSDTPVMKLRKGVADKLADIQRGFGGKYRFKIWDGYRPRQVQDNIYQAYYKELEEKHPDWDTEKLSQQTETFVTKATTQKRIPPHTTGGAVDLTLVDASGKEVDMGTEFDFFGPEAASAYYEEEDKDQTIRDNRRLLRKAMLDAGFSADVDEWWHYNWGNQMWANDTGAQSARYGEVTER